jgi:hypothetical protein
MAGARRQVAKRPACTLHDPITLDLYSHVMPGIKADAAEQVDVAISGAVKPGTQLALR